MHAEQLKLFADIEARHWWFAARRIIARQVIGKVLAPSRENRIVDIGCGPGGNLGAFSNDYSCVGVDASPTAIALARQQLPNVQFLCRKAGDSLSDVVAEANAVLLMDVIEHVADDFQFVSEIVAATRPGTFVFITVPADMALWSPHDETVLHYRRYEEERLRALWAGLPVRERLFSFFNTRLYWLVRLQRMLNRRRRRSSGIVGTDFDMPPAPVNRVLQQVFAGEAARLVRCLTDGQPTGYEHGVSLLVLLERLPGDVRVRKKPVDVPPDPYVPAPF